MGIKNLMKLVNQTNAIKKTKITNYKNKTVGIDTNLLLYKQVYAIRKNGHDILDKNNNKITHIHTMKQKLDAFKKYNITPIFVFDGLQPKLKQDTITKRELLAKKYYRFNFKITTTEINDVKQLINSYNYQIIQQNEEADITLARLAKTHKIDYVISDDMDIILFGAPYVILLKDFTVNTKLFITEINTRKLLDNLIITRRELIDIGIMLGCDYCDSAKNIGPVKAYDIIINNKSWPKPKYYDQVVEYFML